MAHTLSIKQTTGRAIAAERVKLALISPQTRVLRVTRIRYDDNDRPLVLEAIVLPMDRVPSLATNGGDKENCVSKRWMFIPFVRILLKLLCLILR